jgi:hypothetical protein
MEMGRGDEGKMVTNVFCEESNRARGEWMDYVALGAVLAAPHYFFVPLPILSCGFVRALSFLHRGLHRLLAFKFSSLKHLPLIHLSIHYF